MKDSEFADLFIANENQLYLFAKSLTKSEAEAKDILQETAIKAYINIEKLDDPNKFKPWAATILHRLVINVYQKKSRRRKLINKETGLSGHFFNQSTCMNNGYESLKQEDIMNFTNLVGAESMNTFFLYHYGYSYKEIAEKLNIAIGTVKSRINFARRKLKHITREYGIAA